MSGREFDARETRFGRYLEDFEEGVRRAQQESAHRDAENGSLPASRATTSSCAVSAISESRGLDTSTVRPSPVACSRSRSC